MSHAERHRQRRRYVREHGVEPFGLEALAFMAPCRLRELMMHPPRAQKWADGGPGSFQDIGPRTTLLRKSKQRRSLS